MSLSGTISNSAGSPGNKDLVQSYQPLLIATITFTNGTILRLSTHPLNVAEGGFQYGGNDYLARLLDQNIDAVQAMSETGIDIPPTMTLLIADADCFIWTNYEATIGFKGATVTLDLILWEADTSNFSSDSLRKFSGICNSSNVDETTLTVSASSKLNMQKILFPLIPVQTRCPWIFPTDLSDRTEGLSNASSPIYPCGYSADVAGGVGNNLANGGIAANQTDASGAPLTDSAGNYVQCDYTRAGCTLRGMFSEDSRSQPTGRFGGVEWDPPLWWKSKSYLQGKTISGINAPNDQRYSDYVPLAYGQVFVDGVVLNVIGDANSTRMEVLVCFGNIGNGTTSSTGGVKMVIVSGVAIPFNYPPGGPPLGDALFRWQYVNYGNRNGAANTDAGYNGLGDPYGNFAVIEIVVPIVLVGSQTIPSVQILTVGPEVRVWGTGSLTDPTVPGFSYALAGVGAVTGQGNPIWTLMDLLVRANWTYAELNIQNFIDAAAVCDTQIAYTNNAGVVGNTNVDGSPHVRYSLSLQVTKRRTAADVIQGVRNCCKAMLVPNDKTGLLQVFIKQTMADQQPSASPIAGSNNASAIASINAAGASATGCSAYDFDETSILVNDSGASTLKITQRTVPNSPNSIATNFQDQDNQFVVDSMTELDPVDVTRAGQTVSGAVQLDGLNSFDQGQRIFETRFAETYRGNQRGDSGGTLLFTLQTTQKIAHLQVGNLCRFSHQQLGLSFQKVRVIAIQAARDFETTQIQLQWHEDKWYTDTYGQIGAPIYSGNNKQQLSRPPFAWQPYQVAPLPSDLMVSPTNWTFAMDVEYSVSLQGNVIATLEITGTKPVNSFATLAAPLIALQGTSASGSGSIGASQVISAVVCPYDSATPANFAPPEIFPCVITTPNSGSAFTVTVPTPSWPPGASGYDVFAGVSSQSMTYQQTGTGTPASIAIPALNVRAFGPPDVMFDHLSMRMKLQIHGGTWGAAVDAVTSTTLTFSDANWPTNQWAGCDLTITGRTGINGDPGALPVWNLRILSNTATVLTVALATPDLTNLAPGAPAGFKGINVGDAAVMRTLPDTFTALTLGDSKFVNLTTHDIPATTMGLTVNEGNYILRIFAGTGAGQWRNVVSNTATVYTVDQAFNPVPDATSRFWIEEANWQPPSDSSALQNSSMPSMVADPTTSYTGTLNVANYAEESIIVQVLTVDSQGNQCFEQYAPIRDYYIFGAQGTRAITTTGPMLPTDQTITFDATGGNIIFTLLPLSQIGNRQMYFQKVDSSANTVTIQCQGALVMSVWVGDTINGISSFVLSLQYQGLNLAIPQE